MTSSLLGSVGMYGGAAIIAFVAGLFPLMSIEVFLIGLVTLGHITAPQLAVLVVLGAIGHQIAKTMCYFALDVPRKSVQERIERVRHRIERWNRHPWLVLFFASTVGIPPMFVIAFIAKKLMNLRFWPFTLICFAGRVGRYTVMAGVPLLWK